MHAWGQSMLTLKILLWPAWKKRLKCIFVYASLTLICLFLTYSVIIRCHVTLFIAHLSQPANSRNKSRFASEIRSYRTNEYSRRAVFVRFGLRPSFAFIDTASEKNIQKSDSAVFGDSFQISWMCLFRYFKSAESSLSSKYRIKIPVVVVIPAVSRKPQKNS